MSGIQKWERKNTRHNRQTFVAVWDGVFWCQSLQSFYTVWQHTCEESKSYGLYYFWKASCIFKVGDPENGFLVFIALGGFFVFVFIRHLVHRVTLTGGDSAVHGWSIYPQHHSHTERWQYFFQHVDGDACIPAKLGGHTQTSVVCVFLACYGVFLDIFHCNRPSVFFWAFSAVEELAQTGQRWVPFSPFSRWPPRTPAGVACMLNRSSLSHSFSLLMGFCWCVNDGFCLLHVRKRVECMSCLVNCHIREKKWRIKNRRQWEAERGQMEKERL